jgi:phosphohistidine phosphatase
MELYLLRHAHAGDPLAWSGDDAARPLSARGRRQAARLGAHLAALGLRPDAIVSSPKTRARETAAAIGASLGREVRLDARLAAGFDLRALRTLVEELGGLERVVLVGHDPDLSDLLAELTGAVAIPMRKGALARIDLPGKPGTGEGVLRWLLPPETVGRDD